MAPLTRRDAVRRLLLGAGGLLVGAPALKAFERLTHRRIFQLGAIPQPDVVSQLRAANKAYPQEWEIGGLVVSQSVYDDLMAHPATVKRIGAAAPDHPGVTMTLDGVPVRLGPGLPDREVWVGRVLRWHTVTISRTGT